MKMVSWTCAVLMVAVAGTAWADEQPNDLGNGIEPWTSAAIKLGDPPSPETLAEQRGIAGKDCDAFAKKAAKKKGDALMWFANGHPDAKKVGKLEAVPAAKLGWFCDRWRTDLDLFAMRSLGGSAQSAKDLVERGLSDEEKKNIRSNGDSYRKQGKECRAIAEKMLARGDSGDLEVKDRYNKVIGKLSEMPALCDQLIKEADLYDAEWKVASKTFEAPFKAEGVTGDKLEWLVYYGPEIDGWMVKGCKDATSVKQLKKANAWFQWFTDSAGVITIRKFAWKGDKLAKQTEKQFLTEAAAYKKGCK